MLKCPKFNEMCEQFCAAGTDFYIKSVHKAQAERIFTFLSSSAHKKRGISDDGARLKKLFLQLIFILLSHFHLKSLSLIYGDTVVQDGSGAVLCGAWMFYTCTCSPWFLPQSRDIHVSRVILEICMID